MIKAIFFDFDGVLTTDPAGRVTIFRNFVEQTGLPEEKIKECYLRFNDKLKCGSIVHQDMWEEFCQCLGKNIDISILPYVCRHVPLNTKMIDVARQLRDRGYTTGVITSNPCDRMDHMVDEFALDALFDVIVCSGQIGEMKNGGKIFSYALEKANVKAEESIFVDNAEPNLVVPKDMGFHTYFFDHGKNDVEGFVRQLHTWGVKIPVVERGGVEPRKLV